MTESSQNDPQAALRPQRTRLSRRKGTKQVPEGSIRVDRKTRWGNPYPVEPLGRAHAIAAFRALMVDPAARAALDYPEPEEIRDTLAGHDLACWCPLDQPCHADVLLQVANP